MSELMDEKLDKEPLFEDKYCGVYFKKAHTGLPLNQINIEHCFIEIRDLSFIRSSLPAKYVREFIEIVGIVNLKTKNIYKKLSLETSENYCSRVREEIKKENSLLISNEVVDDMGKLEL